TIGILKELSGRQGSGVDDHVPNVEGRSLDEARKMLALAGVPVRKTEDTVRPKGSSRDVWIESNWMVVSQSRVVTGNETAVDLRSAGQDGGKRPDGPTCRLACMKRLRHSGESRHGRHPRHRPP